jgi:hypothetical protein
MEFTYMKTPLYKFTFKNKRIREWVESQISGYTLNLFAGETKLECVEVRNDMREEMPADYHMDAFEFVDWWGKQNARTLFDTVVLDPPYSYRKSMTRYEGAVSSDFNRVKDLLPKIMAYRGNVITFGYHSNVMGKVRGFEQEHILLMSHGGAIHDTIAVNERRLAIHE